MPWWSQELGPRVVWSSHFLKCNRVQRDIHHLTMFLRSNKDSVTARKAGIITTTHLRTFCSLCGSPPSGAKTKGAGLQNLALPTASGACWQHMGLSGDFPKTFLVIHSGPSWVQGRRKGCPFEPWMDRNFSSHAGCREGGRSCSAGNPMFCWVHGQGLWRACHGLTTITCHACNNMPCL